MDRVDCAVVGAGVVGLAVARALAIAGRDVVIVESQGAIGTETSSRNSEVIHAGLGYPAGSHKARLCVRGHALLYRYAEARGIGHRRLRTLIVAVAPWSMPRDSARRNSRPGSKACRAPWCRRGVTRSAATSRSAVPRLAA